MIFDFCAEPSPNIGGMEPSMTKRRAKPKEQGVLQKPKSFGDEAWDVRIARAREARSAAQALRRGKPAAFSIHLAKP
jgi:hypothetical protein